MEFTREDIHVCYFCLKLLLPVRQNENRVCMRFGFYSFKSGMNFSSIVESCELRFKFFSLTSISQLYTC